MGNLSSGSKYVIYPSPMSKVLFPGAQPFFIEVIELLLCGGSALAPL